MPLKHTRFQQCTYLSQWERKMIYHVKPHLGCSLSQSVSKNIFPCLLKMKDFFKKQNIIFHINKTQNTKAERKFKTHKEKLKLKHSFNHRNHWVVFNENNKTQHLR